MAKEYLVEVVGCDDATQFLILADDDEFAVMEKLAERVTEESANGCQPVMSIYEATETDKRWLKSE